MDWWLGLGLYVIGMLAGIAAMTARVVDRKGAAQSILLAGLLVAVAVIRLSR
ncbi:MAG: hypothetical protein QOH47_2436 [Sphingomonadales bacterium]|jgi:hypothetical protein|nr:hypothetical protein [Sphingomonadales bacterium]